MLTYVKVAVGSKDYAVVAAFDKVLFGDFVSKFDAAFTVGGAACLEAVEGFVNLLGFGALYAI